MFTSCLSYFCNNFGYRSLKLSPTGCIYVKTEPSIVSVSFLLGVYHLWYTCMHAPLCCVHCNAMFASGKELRLRTPVHVYTRSAGNVLSTDWWLCTSIFVTRNPHCVMNCCLPQDVMIIMIFVQTFWLCHYFTGVAITLQVFGFSYRSHRPTQMKIISLVF